MTDDIRKSESNNPVLDGVFNVNSNSTPSSVGLVASVFNANSTLSNQTKRLTATNGSSAICLDVSLHDSLGGAVGVTTNPFYAAQSGNWYVGQSGPYNVSQTGIWNVGQSGPFIVGQTGQWLVGQTNAWFIGQTGLWFFGQSGPFNVGQTGSWFVGQSGIWNVRIQDGLGNTLTSQVSGSQRALDVGINVSGTQIDPRTIGSVQSGPGTSIVVHSFGSTLLLSVDEYGRVLGVKNEAINAQWGQMFHVSSNSAALTGTGEVAFLYFQNPNASGKNAKIYRVSMQPTLGNNYVTYRLYIDPTVAANGTALTETGNRQTLQSANVVNVFTGPSITANGSIIKTEVLSGLSGLGRDIPYNFSLWIEANHALLITRQLTANTTIGGVNIEWVEQ